MDSMISVSKGLQAVLAASLLAACAAFQDAERYCIEKGYAQGSSAFQDCVTERQAETKLYRSGRRGGGGQGAGG